MGEGCGGTCDVHWENPSERLPWAPNNHSALVLIAGALQQLESGWAAVVAVQNPVVPLWVQNLHLPGELAKVQQQHCSGTKETLWVKLKEEAQLPNLCQPLCSNM